MKNTDCLRIPIALMVINGVWFPNTPGSNPKKLEKLYFLYAVLFQIFVFFGIILTELRHLFLVMGNVEKTVEASLLLLTHLAQMAKIVVIWCRQTRIKNLLNFLNSPIFNREDPKKKLMLEKKVSLAYMISKMLIIATLFTASMFGIFPLLKSYMTVPLGYPYLTSDSPMFVVTYMYQTLSIFTLAIGDQAEDLLVGGLMMMAAAQIDLLCFELLNVASLGVSEEETYKQTISCVKYHQSIIRFVNELDEIFSPSVFCQFAATCLIMCMTAFQISTSKEPFEILTMIFYLACILAELLVYCYPGQEIIKKSQIVAEAAYCSDWVNSSLRTRKTLLLLIQRAQRPLTITAGKKFQLSLTTFTMILKSSYSYFAVLNQTNEKKF